MDVITYRNTKTTIPNEIANLHESQPVGYAYATPTHYVHLYGSDTDWWWISPGLAVTAAISTSPNLEEWVQVVFGATNIRECHNAAGETTQSQWRPGIDINNRNELTHGLSATQAELHSAGQAIRVLLNRLDDLLLFVEPVPASMATYSHKTRELLILAAMEVENAWKHHMRIAGISPSGAYFNTQDYVRVKDALRLDEYEFTLKPYEQLQPVRPFDGWSATAPSATLPWYDAYNKTKHDRETHFDKATLENCIAATLANLAMYSVRFSPQPLFDGSTLLSSTCSELVQLNLVSPETTSFYVPKIRTDSDHRHDLADINATNICEPWTVKTPAF